MGVGCFGCRAVGRFTLNSLVLVIAFLLILLMVGQVLLGFASFVRGAPMVLALAVGPCVRVRLRAAAASA